MAPQPEIQTEEIDDDKKWEAGSKADQEEETAEDEAVHSDGYAHTEGEPSVGGRLLALMPPPSPIRQVETKADQLSRMEEDNTNVQVDSASEVEKEKVKEVVEEGEEVRVSDQPALTNQVDPSAQAEQMPDSSCSDDQITIGQYFTQKRDATQGQDVLRLIGLQQHEEVIQKGTEKTLLLAEEDLL